MAKLPRSVLLGVLALVLLRTSSAHGDETRKPDIAPDSKALAREIQLAVCMNSEQLRSGVFSAEGVDTYEDFSVDPPEVYSTQVSFRCMFDFNARSIRLDRKPLRWKPERQLADGDQLESGGGQLIVTPDKTVSWAAEGNFALLGKRSERIQQFELFRIDFAGIATRREMTVQRGHDLETIKLQQFFSADRSFLENGPRNLTERFPTDRLAKVQRTSGPLVQLVWNVHPAQAEHSVVFNESSGWMPVRMRRLYTRPRIRTPHGPVDSQYECHQESTVQWQKMDQLYVPVSLRQREESPSSGARLQSIRELSLEIHWESVNSPPDPSCFTWQGLNLPEKVRVIDNRFGKPKLLR